MRKRNSKQPKIAPQPASVKSSRLTSWAEFLALCRKITYESAYIILPVFVLVVLAKQFSHDGIIIDLITIPEEIQWGYNSTNVAEKLIDKAKVISDEAQKLSRDNSWHDESKMPEIDVNTESYLPDIKIPETDFTTRTLIRYLQHVFGFKSTYLRGEVTKTQNGLTLNLRNISERDIPATPFSLNGNLEQLIQAYGGEALLRLAKPSILAIRAYHRLSEKIKITNQQEQAYKELIDETNYCTTYPPTSDDSLAYYLEGKALNDIGIELKNSGDYSFEKLQIAIEKFQKVISLDPKHKMAYYNWAIALYDMGDKQGAIEKYKKVLELDPNDPDVYNNWGVILNELGQYQTAIEKFQKAIALKPNYPSAYSGWGHALAGLGDKTGADEKYLTAGEIAMNDVPNNINIFVGTQPKVSNVTQAVNESTNSVANTFMTMGDALLKNGDMQGAIDNYQKSIELAPDYPIAYKKLGELLKKQGRNDEAEANFKKAQELEAKQKK